MSEGRNSQKSHDIAKTGTERTFLCIFVHPAQVVVHFVLHQCSREILGLDGKIRTEQVQRGRGFLESVRNLL